MVTVEQNSGVTDLKYSPAVDAVQEFKVQTNFFLPEFGQTGGAVVNMIMKSGTNNSTAPRTTSCATPPSIPPTGLRRGPGGRSPITAAIKSAAWSAAR